ncbi:hypothetical protein PIB30_104914 [Stylosanthes scabra]|uniref:Uncharacterized protein n=1 Tax=Stylosanthes scabra TaxID=79078 RepID=A0ABU6WYN7_9FABA|nr:hypothetical protein [Stylosanthes scabra]
MGSEIIYYEIEKREKYEDSDEKADSNMAIVKTRRYHFEDEPFIHPLHSIRFDMDRLYELPIESLLVLRRRDSSKKKDPSPVEDAKGIEEEDKDEDEDEEDPGEDALEEEMPTIPRLMDVDANEDYLQYLEELRRHPEYFPVHSGQAFAQNPSDDTQSSSSDARSQPSIDLSSIWPPPVG